MTYTLEELIEVLDQRFGNPLAIDYFKPVQEAVKYLQILQMQRSGTLNPELRTYDGKLDEDRE